MSRETEWTPESFNTQDTTFRSIVVNDIGSLKSTVDLLKQDIQTLKGQLNKGTTVIDDCDTCLLYIRLKHPTAETLCKALLESKLSTTILSYDIVRTSPTPAFRVKIRKSFLHNAITHARANQCMADIWGGTTVPSLFSTTKTPSTSQHAAGEQRFVKITCWNCRGLSTTIPYLNRILDSGSDIVVLSEHWLWPYELNKLNEIHPGYHGLENADSRLSETSDNLRRGCGGVGMVWKKSLDVTPITDIQSDRICGICIKKISESDVAWISTVGVYLPCLDLGVDLYHNSLVELERVISESERWGPVIIAGDFNAHLGPSWRPMTHIFKEFSLQRCLTDVTSPRCITKCGNPWPQLHLPIRKYSHHLGLILHRALSDSSRGRPKHIRPSSTVSHSILPYTHAL